MIFSRNKSSLNKVYCVLILCIISGTESFSVESKKKSVLSDLSVEFFLKEYQKDFYPTRNFDDFIFVSIKHQKLFYLKKGKVSMKHDVSTSKYGVGSTRGSKKTPLGLHIIQNKIGVGCPINSVLKTGYCSGKIVKVITKPIHGSNDYVTSRILWLNGLDKGMNKGGLVDTYSRNIYIHGTAEEGLIGEPASHGCIRMKNLAVIALFNQVQVSCPVLILDH